MAGGAAGRGARLGDLFPHLSIVIVDKIESAPSGVVFRARYWPAQPAGPACGTWPSRVHSSYVRQVRDLQLGDRPVVIHLAMRRFLCTNRVMHAAGGLEGQLVACYEKFIVGIELLQAKALSSGVNPIPALAA